MPSFIPDLPTILAFALASFVLAITPGPDMALFLSRSIHYGPAHGLVAEAGAQTGVLVHSALAALGISILIATAPIAFLVLKIVGALYLVYLAIQAIRSGDTLAISAAVNERPTLWQSFLTGLWIDLLNPKVVLFFVTFLPQFVDPHDKAAGGKLFFLGVESIVVSYPVATVMIFAAGWLSAALMRTRWVVRMLNWVFAGVFAGFAALILSAPARHA